MSTPEDPRLDPAYQAWLAGRPAVEPVQPEPEPEPEPETQRSPGLSDHEPDFLRQYLPAGEPEPERGHTAGGHDGLGVGVSN